MTATNTVPRPIRVLVVDDSRTVREHLAALIDAAPDLRVVGTASDGHSAVARCAALQPDVMTMDLGMPGMSGLAATEQIMAHTPTPILVVSGAGSRELAFQACDVLAAGAVDAMGKPGSVGSVYDGGWPAELLARIRRVARIRVITHLRGKRDGPSRGVAVAPDPGGHVAAPPAVTDGIALPPRSNEAAGGDTLMRAVALGTSTGGPAALLRILRELPAAFDLPVLVVLHLGDPAGAGLADWLGAHVPLPVVFATHGDPLPPPGTRIVVLAPPDRHLSLSAGRFVLSHGPPLHSCRPAVDALFASLATELGPAVVAGLLTGMGKDGATGLLAIRQAGGMTLAQDETSSVVHGMPGEAIRLNAARVVLPLGEIAATLAGWCRPRAGSPR